MSRADRQAGLQKAYGALYAEVARLVREADPMRLIAIGAPDDEYDPEISTILPRLHEATSRNNVQRLVHEEFAHWFGADVAGPPERYAALSAEIWNLWQRFRGGSNRSAPSAPGSRRVRAKHASRRRDRGG